jgi:hypothetical protein
VILPAPDPAPGTEAVRRAPDAAAISNGSSTIVLHGRTLVELQGIGPVVWSATADWTTPERLNQVLTDVFGPPPGGDVTSVTQSVVNALISQGVMERFPT